jgi:DNA-binding transcriptional ArsR family regulator
MATKIRDGKSNFYRTLDLDKEDRKLIRYYRKLVKDMLNEPENTNSKKVD